MPFIHTEYEDFLHFLHKFPKTDSIGISFRKNYSRISLGIFLSLARDSFRYFSRISLPSGKFSLSQQIVWHISSSIPSEIKLENYLSLLGIPLSIVSNNFSRILSRDFYIIFYNNISKINPSASWQIPSSYSFKDFSMIVFFFFYRARSLWNPRRNFLWILLLFFWYR